MSVGGFFNLTNNVSSTCLLEVITWLFHPTTMASAPFVTQHSVASFHLIITGIPLHSANIPGWCSVLPCDRFHSFSCMDLITLSDDHSGSIVMVPKRTVSYTP